jgi:hypothetical protein
MTQIAIKTILFALLFTLIGCDSRPVVVPASEDDFDPAEQIQALHIQVRKQQTRIDELTTQLTHTRSFGPDLINQLVKVEGIELGRYTRSDAKGLIVYVKLFDQQGDVIKAAGRLSLAIWDLSAEAAGELIGQWHFDAEELQGYWLAGMMNNHFKFTLPWPKNETPRQKNLTLKCTFTEALTGNAFEDQKLVKRSF